MVDFEIINVDNYLNEDKSDISQYTILSPLAFTQRNTTGS